MSEQIQISRPHEEEPQEEILAKLPVQDELSEEEEKFFDEISKQIEEKIGIAKVFKQKGGQ